ncbi:hypothetical protein EYR36_011470 [Pleurotus pulmonarius]|nr:hypothetical protein EYR36_011470 [Pleurotus pulmonarius]
MTELFIVAQLYSKRLDERERIVRITEDALTSETVKDSMSVTLGYPVECLSHWIIVRGPHKSTKADKNHITIRGYVCEDHAITAHLYLNDNGEFDQHVAYPDGKIINAKLARVRSYLY